MSELCDKHLAKKFVEEKLEESQDFINTLREKEFLDSQHKFMLKAEIQEKSFWEYILQLINIDLIPERQK